MEMPVIIKIEEGWQGNYVVCAFPELPGIAEDSVCCIWENGTDWASENVDFLKGLRYATDEEAANVLARVKATFDDDTKIVVRKRWTTKFDQTRYAIANMLD